MPAGDGTGPDGRGGWCTPLWTSGQIPRPLGGAGFGRGFFGRRAPGAGGRGRGRMNLFYATGQPGWARTWPAQPPTLPATQELQPTESITGQEAGYLRDQIEALKRQLEDAEKRLKGLEEEK